MGYSPWGRKESDTTLTEQLTLSLKFHEFDFSFILSVIQQWKAICMFCMFLVGREGSALLASERGSMDGEVSPTLLRWRVML